LSKKIKKSPLAPETFPSLPNIKGIRLSAVHSGIRYKDKLDLSLITMDEKTNVACVLTKSSTPSAPVLWCKKIKNFGKARALIVNSGNANAHTGKKGYKTVEDTVDHLSKYLDCKKYEVYVCSTGVIGEFLKTDIITSSIPKLIEQKSSSWKEVAESICTTDTFIKGAKANCKIDDIAYKIVGIAKGSGMIFPKMGTMLAFIFTDFPLSSNILNIVLKDAVEKSFNSITVDGDTSTSDTCLLFSSNKKSLNKPIKSLGDKRLKLFRKSLNKVLQSLAQQIVCDGEGASKFITINVNSAKSYKIAKKIALSVANSSLVKTAIAGEDPNWGRIIMAIGKSGESIRQESISISINKAQITYKGALINNYNEKVVAKKMKSKNIEIDINIGSGKEQATVWTCDLTKEYIKINADYRS
tara:strand:+ start:1087 stop:2325 length:1239 start_codon:yes stop_codon:yes gene_type:complete